MNKELNFLMYNTPEEDVSIRALAKDDSMWLTQKAMAELFGCSTDNISLHLKNIYSDGELDEKSTTEEISVVKQEGKGRISKKQADDKAKAEYDEFNKTQKINSDFDKQIKRLRIEYGE